MESMEEDAIAALTLMSSGGGPDGAGAASLGRESKVKMDVLEADAKRVGRTHGWASSPLLRRRASPNR